MAANTTSFKTGQSGNPKGRPTKIRALTEILNAAGSEKCADGADGEITRKKLMARMLWQAATSGQVTFFATNRDWGANRTYDLTTSDWFMIVRWLFNQIDGELRMEIKQEDSDEDDDAPSDTDSSIKPQIYLPDNGRDPKSESSPDSTTET